MMVNRVAQRWIIAIGHYLGVSHRRGDTFPGVRCFSVREIDEVVLHSQGGWLINAHAFMGDAGRVSNFYMVGRKNESSSSSSSSSMTRGGQPKSVILT